MEAKTSPLQIRNDNQLNKINSTLNASEESVALFVPRKETQATSVTHCAVVLHAAE